MQLKTKNKFDIKKVEQYLNEENKFITELFSIASIPERKDEEEYENEEGEASHHPKFSMKGEKTRAKSLQELQQRLHAITSKKRLTYKEKLTKKVIKNRMKKKGKQDERNAKQKLARAVKLSGENIKEETDKNSGNNKTVVSDSVFNGEDKMVFSKFDFEGIGQKKDKKQEKDPKKLLKKLEDEKVKLKQLKDIGEIEKAVEIKEKTVWRNALAKVRGEKIKDDPELLKKSVKKKEQKQRSSKKKWENRIHGVQKAKDERQQKRTENIEKRKKEKKNKKLKKAAKKGKIIPGF